MLHCSPYFLTGHECMSVKYLLFLGQSKVPRTEDGLTLEKLHNQPRSSALWSRIWTCTLHKSRSRQTFQSPRGDSATQADVSWGSWSSTDLLSLLLATDNRGQSLHFGWEHGAQEHKERAPHSASEQLPSSPVRQHNAKLTPGSV